MTDQEIEINVAIAEACGWKDIWVECAAVGIPPEAKSRARMESRHIPNYCNDLNAMHEAEKMLDKNNFISYLRRVIISGHIDCLENCVFATARQRAEAFLRTKGLWRDAIVEGGK